MSDTESTSTESTSESEGADQEYRPIINTSGGEIFKHSNDRPGREDRRQ